MHNDLLLRGHIQRAWIAWIYTLISYIGALIYLKCDFFLIKPQAWLHPPPLELLLPARLTSPERWRGLAIRLTSRGWCRWVDHWFRSRPPCLWVRRATASHWALVWTVTLSSRSMVSVTQHLWSAISCVLRTYMSDSIHLGAHAPIHTSRRPSAVHPLSIRCPSRLSIFDFVDPLITVPKLAAFYSDIVLRCLQTVTLNYSQLPASAV